MNMVYKVVFEEGKKAIMVIANGKVKQELKHVNGME